MDFLTSQTEFVVDHACPVPLCCDMYDYVLPPSTGEMPQSQADQCKKLLLHNKGMEKAGAGKTAVSLSAEFP